MERRPTNNSLWCDINMEFKLDACCRCEKQLASGLSLLSNRFFGIEQQIRSPWRNYEYLSSLLIRQQNSDNIGFDQRCHIQIYLLQRKFCEINLLVSPRNILSSLCSWLQQIFGKQQSKLSPNYHSHKANPIACSIYLLKISNYTSPS
jgi:hypothetical protein